MSKQKKLITILVLILSGESIFLLPFVLPRIFRPTMLDAFDINNTQLGSYFSVYGIVAMLSYFFGGPLADKYPARNLIGIAMTLTGLGGITLYLFPSPHLMYYLYGFWGFTTIFLFWAALIRATREWGGTSSQGKAFGWLEGGRGATAAIIGTFFVFVFSSLKTTRSGNPSSLTNLGDEYFKVIGFASLFVLFVAYLAYRFIPVNRENYTREKIKTSHVKKLVKQPKIILLSIIIVCAYVGYKFTDDFSLYAHEVFGLSEIEAAGVGTLGLWMRALVAICVGYLADKFTGSGIIVFGFIVSIIGSLLIYLGFWEAELFNLFINLILVMVGVYSIRALYFTLIQEAKIPIIYTGTAVGIVSVVGYTPDIFAGPLMGVLLDSNPGAEGHRLVFMALAAFSLVGLAATLLFIQYKKKG